MNPSISVATFSESSSILLQPGDIQMSIPPIKPQPTLKGYDAWAFSKLAKIWGASHAEVAARIIHFWFHDNKQMLLDEYGISVKDFIERNQILEEEQDSITSDAMIQ